MKLNNPLEVWGLTPTGLKSRTLTTMRFRGQCDRRGRTTSGMRARWTRCTMSCTRLDNMQSPREVQQARGVASPPSTLGSK